MRGYIKEKKIGKRMVSMLLAFLMVFSLIPLERLTVYAESSADITVAVDTASTYKPTQIVNGGFETVPWIDFTYNGVTYTQSKKYSGKIENLPTVGSVSYNGVDGGWNTTETTYYNSLFERSNNISTYGIQKPKSGSYFVEMNSANSAVLYQDLTTQGGDIILWTLDHAARHNCSDPVQPMQVEIGASDGNFASGVGSAINTHISDATKVVYSSSGITNPSGYTYGYGNSTELSYLTLNQLSSNNPWYTAKGVYIVPDGQTATRFAFVSTAQTPGGGNLLDNITFSTLIGNLSASADNARNVTVKGYWGDSDSSKKLVIQIGSTAYQVDMSSVLNQNFTITIPSTLIGDETSVTIYHSDYSAAAKTVIIKKATTGNDVEYDCLTGTYSAKTVGIGTVTTYYYVNNSWTTSKPSAVGSYQVGFIVGENDTYASLGTSKEPAMASPAEVYTIASDYIVYVKADGDDTNGKGTLTQPFKTIKRAYNVITASSSPAGTIALLSDITMDSEDQVWLQTSKPITITSAGSDGSLLTNTADDYTGVYRITRGGITKSLFVLNSGALTLTQVILDGGSKDFTYSGDGGKNQGGYLINVYSSAGSPTLTLTTNAKLQNNWNTGSNGASLGGALVVGYDTQTTYYPTIYLKSNAEISGNKAPRHGGAITCYTGSKIYMSDDARIKDNSVYYKSSYTSTYYGGGAVLVHNDSQLHLSGNAKIYNNYVDLNGASGVAVAVQADCTGKIYLSDNAKIFDNFSKNIAGVADNKQSNVYDKTSSGDAIIIEGALGESAKIGITAKSLTSGSTIASGSTTYTVTAGDADKIFDDSLKFAVTNNGNTIVLTDTVIDVNVLSKSLATNKYSITLDQGMPLITGDESLFLNGVQMDKSAYRISSDSEDKEIVITFSTLLASGDKVGLQVNKNGYKFNGGLIAEETLATTLKAMTISTEDGTATYDGSATNGGASLSVSDPTTGFTIKYGRTKGTYDLDTMPTFTQAGNYTVYYKVIADGYMDETGSMSISIAKAESSLTAPAAKTLTYTGEDQELVSAGSSSTGTVWYKLDSGAYSTVIPSASAAGTYTISYKLVGDSNHKDIGESSLTVTIGKASQSLSFAETNPSRMVIRDADYTQIVTGAKTSVTYSGNNIEVASVDATTGKVTILKDGTLTVTASATATDNYQAASASYTLTVVKDQTAPSLDIKISEDSVKKAFTAIQFSKYFQLSQTVKILASDGETGMSQTCYYVSDQILTENQVKAITEWTSGDSLTLSGNRNFVVYAKAVDKAGNVSYVGSDGIVIDSQAPVVAGIESGMTYSQAVEFTVTDANLASVKLDENLLVAENGKYTLPADGISHKITAIDRAGNTFVITNVKANMTAVAGDFTFETPGNLTYDGKTKSASLTTTREGMGTFTIKYYKDQACTTESDTVMAAGTYYVAIDLEQGDKYEAASGLTDSAWQFTIERADQTLSFATSSVIKLAVKDREYSQIVTGAKTEVLYSSSNEDVASVDPYNGKVTIKKAGEATITASAQESLNYNGAEASYTMTVTEDTTAPSFDIKLGGSSIKIQTGLSDSTLYFQKAQTLTITAEDADTGVAQVSYFVSNQKLTQAEQEAIQEEDWTPGNSLILDVNGTYVIYLKAIDRAGNTAYGLSREIVIDNQNPLVFGLVNGMTYCSSPSFTVIDDNLDSVKIDGNQVSSKSGAYCIPADNKKHSLLVKDKAGNTTSITVTVNKNHTETALGTAKDATCTQEGITTGSKCAVCGITLEEQATLPATGHAFSGEWTVTREATATKEGKRETSCQNGCGAKKVEAISPTGEEEEDPSNGNLNKETEVEAESPVDSASIDNSKADLMEASGIFTQEEKVLIENGKDAKVYLTIADVDLTQISEEDQLSMEAAAKEELGQDSTMQYVDISLFKQVGDEAAVSIHEPQTEIEITLGIPEDLLNHDPDVVRKFRIVRLHEGQVETISGTFNAQTNEFIFKTSKFSTYAIAYSDEKIQIEISTPENNTTLTKVGESMQLGVVVYPVADANQAVNYTTSDEKVASVDKDGKVTAVGNGQATITVTTANGAVSKAFVLTVDDPTFHAAEEVGEISVTVVRNDTVKVSSPKTGDQDCQGWLLLMTLGLGLIGSLTIKKRRVE